MTEVRLAVLGDSARIASLHCERITEGFLPSLGEPFLTRLYSRVVRSTRSFVYVAIEDAEVVGFAAATEAISGLYRTFIVRDGVVAGIKAAPHIIKSAKRVWETLRYPSSTKASDGEIPTAEIIAVAVAAASSGRGIGRSLVDAVSVEMDSRQIHGVKVVAATDNAAAAALYIAAGYTELHEISVHGSAASTVFVRRSAPGQARTQAKHERPS